MIANTPSVLNCRVRNADAPSCTAWAMFFMLVVPSPAARTSLRNIIPMASAMTAMTADDDDEGEVATGQVHGRNLAARLGSKDVPGHTSSSDWALEARREMRTHHRGPARDADRSVT